MTQSTKPQAASGASAPTTFVDDRLLKAEIAASEARTDTKFEKLIGKIEGINSQITAVNEKIVAADAYNHSMKWQIMVAIITSTIALGALAYSAAGVGLAGMSFTASAFQAGMAAGTSKGAEQAARAASPVAVPSPESTPSLAP